VPFHGLSSVAYSLNFYSESSALWKVHGRSLKFRVSCKICMRKGVALIKQRRMECEGYACMKYVKWKLMHKFARKTLSEEVTWDI
jgi:hypothetical protein